MRNPIRLHPLFAGLLLAGCAAFPATNAGQTDLYAAGIPQPCADDFVQPTLPEVPPHCPAEVFEEDGWSGCLTEDYMRSVVDDPEPSIEAQMLWQRFARKRHYDGDAYFEDFMAAIEAEQDTSALRRNDYYMNLSDRMVDFIRQHVGSQPQVSEAERAELRRRTRSNLVEVEGGTFQMGDFGHLVGNNLPFTTRGDNLLHDVRLSDFAILRHRVTFGDYDLYSRDSGAEVLTSSLELDIGTRFKNIRARHVSWEQARGYCQWLGEQIDRPLDLPTEAQWEYAARAGGQLLTVGSVLPSEDIGEPLFKRYTSCRSARSYPSPIGTFPPNALGIYEMVGHGDEWIRDWYGADYYASHGDQVAFNPTGPDNGTERVVRTGSRNFLDLTITRRFADPSMTSHPELDIGFRCATPPPAPR